MISQDVLVELDTLLDTRFGLLCQRFPSQVPTVNMEEYVNRNHNKLHEIFSVNKNEWESAWEQIDLTVLKHSHVTS